MQKPLLIGLAVAIVALLAVILLAGKHQPGPASTADSKTLITQGQALATAWQSYKAKTGQSPVEAKQLLDPKLLPALPVYPAAAGDVPPAPYSIAAIGPVYYAFADAGAPAAGAAPGKADANAALCQRLDQAATKAAPEHYVADTLGQLVQNAALGNGTFGCGVIAGKPPLVLPGSGLFPVIGHYSFFYKLG